MKKHYLLTVLLLLIGLPVLSQALEVLSTTPGNGEAGIETNEITINFNQKIWVEDEDDADFFDLIPFGSADILDYEISPSGTSITFQVDLASDTDYTAVVLGAMAENGEVMDVPYLFTFSTAPDIGEFVVQGSFIADDMEALKADLENDFVVVVLSPDPFIIGEADGDNLNIAYATVLTDLENLTYSFPYVREGTYYPYAFQAENDLPVYYIYDTDGNLEATESIEVDFPFADGALITGIDLMQIKFDPITFMESVDISATKVLELDEDAVLFLANANYDSNYDKEPYLLEGKSGNWQQYYYNPSDDFFYRISVGPDGAEVRESYTKDNLGFRHDLPLSAYLPINIDMAYDSDYIMQLAEDVGGADFRLKHEDDYEIQVRMELNYEYNSYVFPMDDHILPNWTIEYAAVQDYERIDYLTLYFNPYNGNFMGQNTPNFAVEGYLTHDDIQVLRDEIQDKTVSVYLTSEPAEFTMNEQGIYDFEYHTIVDNETLTFRFNHVPSGTYYVVGIVEEFDVFSVPLPTYFFHNTVDGLSYQAPIDVNTANAVDYLVSDIELKRQKIQPITLDEARAKVEPLLDENTSLDVAFSHYAFFQTGDVDALYAGTSNNWFLHYYNPIDKTITQTLADPFSGTVLLNYPVEEEDYENFEPFPSNLLSSYDAALYFEENGSKDFINEYYTEEDDNYANATYYLLNDNNFETNLSIYPPDNGSGFYWTARYSIMVEEPGSPLPELKLLSLIIDAVTGEVLEEGSEPEPPVEGETFVVEGTITADDIEALKQEVEGELVMAILSRNKPIGNLIGGEVGVDIAYEALVNTETLSFSFPNVVEGTYYPLAISGTFDDGGLPVFYVYDTDGDFKTEESITVGTETTVEGIYSGVTLQKWELLPLSYEESVAMVQESADEEGTTLTLYAAITDASQDTDEDTNSFHILEGKSYYWAHVYRNVDEGKIYMMSVTPFGIEIEAVADNLEELGIPVDVSFETFKEIPVNAISSSHAISIAEENGGTDLRNSYTAAEEMELEIKMHLSHEYWEFEPNPTPTAPVMWTVKYYIYDYSGSGYETTDSLLVYMDALTGEVLHKVYTSNEPESNTLPVATALHQNYPNPFNPTTSIPYSLAKTGHVELSIYNMLGQKITTLLNQNMQAGNHIIQWDASQYSSGLYLYRMKADGVVKTRKLTLIK